MLYPVLVYISGKGGADLVSSLEEDTLTKSKAKLRLHISTAATFTEGLATNGETSGHRLDRESLNNDFCVSEITFLNEIVLFNRRSQGPQSTDQRAAVSRHESTPRYSKFFNLFC
jgi:hypothetical protein